MLTSATVTGRSKGFCALTSASSTRKPILSKGFTASQIQHREYAWRVGLQELKNEQSHEIHRYPQAG